MTEPIVLPGGVAMAILAFLLSLLPAGLFLWLWYLRRIDRPVPAGAVVLAFVGGMVLVGPAFWLETQAPRVWGALSPGTVYYYEGAVLPLQTLADILLPAVGTFLVVALVEEGVRYLFLATWFRITRAVDQLFDGLLLGLAAGLGFATLENTIYFFSLFEQQSFDTLVFVFFLRFMVSTLAHISFGGIMGVLLAKGLFGIYRRGWYFVQAFLLPWFLHGAYDWLLGVNQPLYAVLILLPALLVLVVWSQRRDFFVINREGRRWLVVQRPPGQSVDPAAEAVSPWNRYAPWLHVRRSTMRRSRI